MKIVSGATYLLVVEAWVEAKDFGNRRPRGAPGVPGGPSLARHTQISPENVTNVAISSKRQHLRGGFHRQVHRVVTADHRPWH